ncbi:MAG: c-type cytochrome [Planctomycetales bacterium]|nr:c-type cytochrome [Planctomycetales bacterium]
MLWRRSWLLATVIGVCGIGATAALHAEEATAEASKFTNQLRRPAAIALSADEQRLFVANRDSGSISVIDAAALRTALAKRPVETKAAAIRDSYAPKEEAGEYGPNSAGRGRAARLHDPSEYVVTESSVGKRLTDLVSFAASRAEATYLLTTDEQSHQLLLLKATADDQVETLAKLDVAPYPVTVAFDAERRRAFVASLWSRQLTVVDVDAAAGNLSETRRIDLPFAPRRQCLVRGGSRLIVADSFAGRLAVLDAEQLELLGDRHFPAHNIRGLAVTPGEETLLVSHQMLNELANTIRNDVHWGLLMSNDLRWFKLDAVLDMDSDLFDQAHMHPLGEAGRATADPEDLFVAADGTVVATMGGVGEIAYGRERDFTLQRMKVGRRPVDVTITGDSQTAFVANMFSDSLSVIDLGERKLLGEAPLGPSPELSLAQHGELLFHDGRLSHDGWMTCNSCHIDGHTNGMQNDNLSDQGFGAPKRVLSLLGVKDTAPYAWNGGVNRLEDQIRNSIEKTMQSDDEVKGDQVKAIAAYLRTLEPPPAYEVLRARADEAAVARGRELFASLQCTSCHAPPLYTTPDTYDVGLVDREGNRLYNPPSLRGVSQRGPYLHDDQTRSYDDPPQAVTLDDVFRKFRHQLPRNLDDKELRDLLAFLRSL